MSEPIIFIEAYACSDFAEGPSFATFRLTESLIEELQTMAQLCALHGFSEILIPRGCLWGPNTIQDELRLQSDELVVCCDAFWFRATPKHSDYHVESRAQPIADVIDAAKDWKEGDAPIAFGEYDDEEWADIIEGEFAPSTKEQNEN